LLTGVWKPPSSPDVNGAVPVMFWACPVAGPTRTAAAASKAPPMYRWHITRIPLHCVDDCPRQVPQPSRRLDAQARASVPCRVISRTWAESRGDDNGRSHAVKAVCGEIPIPPLFFRVPEALRREDGEAPDGREFARKAAPRRVAEVKHSGQPTNEPGPA